MKKIIIIFIILGLTLSQSDLILNLMDQRTTQAACLDGSAPGYYFSPGFEGGEDKYLVYFEGGGNCNGVTEEQILADCFDRSLTELGSSKEWEKIMPIEEANTYGILSFNQSDSSFYNWNKIYIKYCDGSIHQGYNKDAKYKQEPLFFRGDINTRTMFNHILTQKGMDKASNVLLTGESAGGMAAYFWADYLKSIISPQTQYQVAPDGGFCLNVPNLQTKRHPLQDNYLALFAVTNKDAPMPNQKCVQDNEGNELNCVLTTQFLLQYIESPLFIIESQYDYWMLYNVVGADCIDDYYSMKDCNNSQMFGIQTYRELLLSTFDRLAQNKKNSFWSVACVRHCFIGDGESYNSDIYQVPFNSGATVNKKLYEWVTNGNQQSLTNDIVIWPNNQGCATVEELFQ